MRENYEWTVIESQICRNICVIPLRWAAEQSLTEKHDSYSMFVWNLECTFKTCKSENKNLLVYSGLVHLPDTPTMKWTRPLLYIYKASKGPNPSLQMEELQEAPVKSTAGMYCCKVCDKSFSRKDNLSRHLLIHSEKNFQCHHCSKCYSQQGKLKIHQTRHHLDAKPISSKNSLVCANCSKMFGRSFNFKHHMAVCKKKSVEATKSDMEAMMLEMTQAERQYRQKLEVGETVSTLLNSNEHLSEESLSNDYKKALKMYRQSQVQHVPVYEHATLKPWQKEVLTFIQQPTHREVIWVVGQKGGEGKTFLQNYIKSNYSGRRVIVTDMATSTKDIAYFLSKFPLECKDIFLFNHPCSTTETIAYDMLEGIKDGHKVSAK